MVQCFKYAIGRMYSCIEAICRKCNNAKLHNIFENLDSQTDKFQFNVRIIWWNCEKVLTLWPQLKIAGGNLAKVGKLVRVATGKLIHCKF